MLRALTENGVALPPHIAQWFSAWQNMTTRWGGANLLTMRKILPQLEAAGIPVIVFKGAVLQQMAYGSMFHRPSSDLDLLVDLADFDRAGQLLAGVEYKLSPVCRSLWWKLGLGEQHFDSVDLAAVTLDLHHRVQQPGCPLPQHPARFFDQRHDVILAGQPVPTLSLVHSALLAAMSCAKALHHREPALRYILDLVALVHGPSRVPWRDIMLEAELQGLANTLRLATRGAKLILGPAVLPDAEHAAILTRVSDATLGEMIICPDDPSIVWPKRRDLLFNLVDRKSQFIADLAAMVGSDLLRRAAGTAGPGRDHEGNRT